MIAAVLCGGLGTRLRSTIGEHQKCAVEIGGRPWIHRVLDFLRDGGGITEAVLLTGYKPEEIERAAGAWVKPSMKFKLTCLHTTPAGPEAAVASAIARSDAREILAVNGDTLIEGFPLWDFLAACVRNKQSCEVLGRNAVGPPGPLVNAGLTYVVTNTPARSTWPMPTLFLDIGTPAGLAEAHRRFGSPAGGTR